jgi:hypothetical protein
MKDGKKKTYYAAKGRPNGAARVLEERRKESEKRRINKIATLRKYEKLCQREGIQSSRINVAHVRTAASGSSPEGRHRDEGGGGGTKTAHKERPAKADPFGPAKKEASRKRDERDAYEKERQRVAAEINAAKKLREGKRRLFARGDRKQPNLNTAISTILGKLQDTLHS